MRIFSLLAVKIKLWPFLAIQEAISKPIPEDAPVINVYLFFMELILPV
jgi:hypothetical protein